MKKLFLMTSSLFMASAVGAAPEINSTPTREVASAVASTDAGELSALFDAAVFKGIMRSAENKRQAKVILDNLISQLNHLDNQLFKQAKGEHESEKKAEHDKKSYMQLAKEKAGQMIWSAEDETPHIKRKFDNILSGDDVQVQKRGIIKKFYDDYMRDLVSSIQGVPDNSVKSLTAFRDAYAVHASVLSGLERIIEVHLKNKALQTSITEEVITQYNLIIDSFIHLSDHAGREALVQKVAQSMIQADSTPSDDNKADDEFWAGIAAGALDGNFSRQASTVSRQATFDEEADHRAYMAEMEEQAAIARERKAMKHTHGEDEINELRTSDVAPSTLQKNSEIANEADDLDESEPGQPLPLAAHRPSKARETQRLASEGLSDDDDVSARVPSRDAHSKMRRTESTHESIPSQEDMLGIVEARNVAEGALKQLVEAMNDQDLPLDDHALHRMFSNLDMWTGMGPLNIRSELDRLQESNRQPALNVAFRNAHQAVANYKAIIESFEDLYPDSDLVSVGNGATLLDKKSGVAVPSGGAGRSTSQISRQQTETYGDED